MAISFANGRGAYFPAPKVACTSIKEAIYELEYGHQFTDEFVNGVCVKHIHMIYGTNTFTQASRNIDSKAIKVALVRDPIKRILSAYRNRVVDLKDLSNDVVGAEVLKKSNLLPNPDIDFFFSHIKEYMNISKRIDHHFCNINTFLGDDLSYFDRVFRFEEFVEFRSFVSALAERDVRFPHSKKTEIHVEFESLSPQTKNSIMGHVDDEYRYLREYYNNDR
jgi:hypothetical protein